MLRCTGRTPQQGKRKNARNSGKNAKHNRKRKQPRAAYLSGVSRVDDSIIPESRTGIKGVALLLVLGQNGLLEGSLLLGGPSVAWVANYGKTGSAVSTFIQKQYQLRARGKSW